MPSRARVLAYLAGLIVAVLIVLGLAASFLVDWSWFSSVGYAGVFWTTVVARLGLFFVVFLLSALAIGANGLAALRAAGPRTQIRLVNSPWDSLQGVTPPALLERLYRILPWRLMVLVVALVLGALIALGEIGNWSLVLRYFAQVPYGQTDPLFGRDISFYLFSLPFFIALKGWLFTLIVFSALVAGAFYWVHGAVAFDQNRRWIAPAVLAHASVLIGLFLAVEAWSFWLAQLELVYDDNGVVVGAGYTDVHVMLPILWVLVALSAAGAVASFLNLRMRSLRTPLAALALVFGVSLVVVPIATAVFQRVFVKPNELNFEAPYITRNIAMTREAYNLNKIVVKPFQANDNLTYQDLQNNRPTIDNIRLWDWQPLLDAYVQLQELRPYYKFRDADIDRYTLDGKYQQVMLSAREMDSSLLSQNAQTWVNRHVLFTHGNGVVMSPVTQTTPEGLPELYLRDIPPVATGGPPIREPRIYFGEGDSPYAIVKGSTPEFDYPKGDSNVYAYYDGRDGVPVGSLARRLLFSWYYGDINLLFSEYITGQSRIMLHRNIQERVRTIAPFLTLDGDPYVVISHGRIFWMQDAYTTSNWFPYSKRVEGGSLNYIRNAVKVVIDAYNGSVDFYISDPSDRIVETYARIYPQLFKPLSAMPADLRKHIRYPEDMFQIQAQLYRAYHMETPEVFYNREDLWQFPRQPTGVDDGGDTKMQPYFLNTRLPGETRTEFIVMLPMVPNQRENMIAWLAARCDPTDYGKLIVYQFPKDKLVYGPFQIEALINQNTEISQQISLWNQQGSRVIRGAMLVVPIENSLLYVSPLYLRAQSGQLPELKRVIAVFGSHVVMERTLGEALAGLFKPSAATAEEASATETPQAQPAVSAAAAATARTALEHYDRAMTRLKAGDWSGFGAELDAMHGELEQLDKSAAPKAK